MPADHGFGRDDYERLLPLRPKAFRNDPQQAINTPLWKLLKSRQIIIYGSHTMNWRRKSWPRIF
jgi:hypothetical protein